MIKRSALAGAALVACNVAALAQTTVLGPVTTSVTAGTAATLAALASNPARKAVTICNGSATSTVTISTGSLTPISLTTGIVLQTGNVVSSCFTIGTPGLGPSGGVGAAINVIASSAGVPVTFVEYF
jgi:hypothetical protein